MNRTTRWYQTSRENKRPRRQRYQLLNVDEDSEVTNEHNDSINLKSIRSDTFVEKVLEPGDSLQTLSLQFNCPVAELKRINHILRDNEIYARRKIKVPVKPGSIVVEKLARVHVSNGLKIEEYNECANTASSTDEETDNLVTSNLKHVEHVVTKPNSNNSLYLDSYSKREEILNYKPVPSASPILLSDALLSLEGDSSFPISVLGEDVNSNSENFPFKCNGADCGLSWLQLVICALLLGFGGPFLFYILYLAEKKY